MTIDSQTLERWAGYENGAITSAQTTHQRIRSVLNDSQYFSHTDFDDFLQGSYRNYTIVRGSSDVDIVAKLTDTLHVDLSALSDDEKSKWRDDRIEPTYSWGDFRSDVISTLEDHYGTSALTRGGKALEIETSALPLDADVLVSQEFRKYYSYPGGYYEGVVFWDTSGNKIINYPQRHIDSGSSKETNTGERFKETVRIFKRARNYLVSNNEIAKAKVPSYFIENLLYNAPDGRYAYDKQERFEKILRYLERTDYSDWTCQNGITDLFGRGDTKWRTRYADRYVSALGDLWENW